MISVREVLQRCRFPERGTTVDLAVSGGGDSVAMTFLAREAGLRATVHYIDHHLRDTSGDDGLVVQALATRCEFAFVIHHVHVEPGANLEARARSARRQVLPSGSMTAHSMDDLAETVLINLMRGASVDGLSPMVGDSTKPVLAVRRFELREIVHSFDGVFVDDATNQDQRLLRNRIRLSVLPLLNDAASRDLVPILARQATVLRDERDWMEAVSKDDLARNLSDVDCTELTTWYAARLRRWLRFHLKRTDDLGDSHPPSVDEIDRVSEVIHGRVTATQLTGSRRVERSHQRLTLFESRNYASPSE